MESVLHNKHCESCEGIGQALSADQIQRVFPQLAEGWQVSADHKTIRKSFAFTDFYETMAFVNALAWMAHIENHHPDLEVSYKHCLVSYTTHALSGLSMNDFICAAKVDQLLQG